VSVWIAGAVFFVIFANLSTDIVGHSCIPWGAYSSHRAEVTLTAFNILIVYVIPLVGMVACYSRIVYTLRRKVTSARPTRFVVPPYRAWEGY